MSIVRKGYLICIGLGAITKEKAEKLARRLIKKGEINEPEAKKFVRDVMSIATNERKRLSREIFKETRKAAKEMLSAMKKDIRVKVRKKQKKKKR